MNEEEIKDKLSKLDEQFIIDTIDIDVNSDRWLALFKHHCSVKWEMLRDNGQI